MKRRLLLLPLLAAAAACAFLLFMPPMQDTQNTTKKDARAMTPGADEAIHSVLFPGLDADAVTSLSVRAADRSFQFQRENLHSVSVNGRHADIEIFDTLIDQIADIAIAPADPSMDSGEPILQLLIVAGGKQYQASFYAGSGSSAFIKAGGHAAPGYHQTAGWRVGTLMLACEGTRILDEHGAETPVM